jgi:hypothetical protein
MFRKRNGQQRSKNARFIVYLGISRENIDRIERFRLLTDHILSHEQIQLL